MRRRPSVRPSLHNKIPMHTHCSPSPSPRREIEERKREGVRVHHPDIHFATTEAAVVEAAADASAMSDDGQASQQS